MADPEKIVFYTPEGALAARGGYDVAVRRLYELENQPARTVYSSGRRRGAAPAPGN